MEEFAAWLVEDTPVTSWLALIGLGLAFETMLRRRPPRLARLANVGNGALLLLAQTLTLPAVNALVVAAASRVGLGLVDLRFSRGEGLVPELGAGLVYLVIYDFFFYWWHRAQHGFAPLWMLHAVHHSDTEVDVTTTLRHHWSELAFQSLLIQVPIVVLFALSPVTIWLVSTIVVGWTFFTHLDLRLPFGRWSCVVTGPQLHRTHHARSETADRNFAAFLPLWDVLFGTYRAPGPDEFPATGLASGERIDGLAALALWPLGRWLRRKPSE